MNDRSQGDGDRILSRAAFALAVVSMAVFLVALNWWKMSNNDIWIHLKTGQWILENGWVPGNDIYSWNVTDRPYVAFEWLAGLFFYFVYELGGVKGLLISKIATMVAIWALLYDTARMLGARLSVILPGMAVVVYIAVARILVRPHIFTYLFIALFIWLFFRYRQRGRKRIWLYAMLPAQVLWINIHGAWPTGVLLVATFALGEGLSRLRAQRLGSAPGQALSGSDMRVLAALVPATLAVNLINPYGWTLITFPFEVFAMKIYMTGIYEWKPPYDPAFNTSTMFFFYLVQLAMLAAGFFLAHREEKGVRSGGEPIGFVNNALLGVLALYFLILAFWWLQPAEGGSAWNADNLKYALYFLFGLFSLFTLVNYRTVDFTQAGIFAMLFLLSLRHNRNVTDAAIGTFPIMAAAFSGALDRLSSVAAPRRAARGRGRKRIPAPQPAADAPPAGSADLPGSWSGPPDPSSPWSVLAGSALLLAVSAHAAIFTYYYDFRGAGREKGLGVANNMPMCGVEFIERNHLTGNAFTSYPYASPLIHRMYPEVKVNMDSRNGHVYGEKVYADYLRTLQDPALMREYLAKNDVDFFFMSHSDRSAKVFEQVESSGEWATVFLDDRGFVMVRRTPENAEMIRREEFRLIRPTVWGQTRIDTSNALAVLDEAERAIRNCPGAPFGHFYKLRALAALGRRDDALATGLRLIEISPRNAQVLAFVGGIYEQIGKKDEAIELLDRALAADPTLTAARDALTRLRGI